MALTAEARFIELSVWVSCVIPLCPSSLIAKLIFMTSFLLLGLLLSPGVSIVPVEQPPQEVPVFLISHIDPLAYKCSLTGHSG